MEWDCALEVTATIVNADQIRLAPSPLPEGPASGPYGIFLEGLEHTVSRIVLPQESASIALRKTRNWANRNLEKLRAAGKEFTEPAPCDSEAASWLNANIEMEWLDHVLRRGALFDRVFVQQISKTLDLSPKDTDKLWHASSDASFVSRLIRHRAGSDDFHTFRDAHVISSLLRARFHEYAAENSGTQILSHPVRASVLRKLPEGIPVTISNTERFLSNIVMASAFAEKKHDARVAMWVENVVKLRQGRARINLDPKDRDETARDVAIEAARRSGVRIHSTFLENFLDVGLSLGSVALSLALSPWHAGEVGTATYLISRKRHLGRAVAGTFHTLTGKLDRLADLVPGRIGSDLSFRQRMTRGLGGETRSTDNKSRL